MIRGTGLANFSALVTDLGGNPNELLYRSGIRPQDAGDPNVFFAYRSLVLAVEGAAESTGALDFGRQLALRQGIEILGPVGVAARTAPTVRQGLGMCATYLAAHTPSVQVDLVRSTEPERTVFELRIVGDHLPAHPQTYELSLGVALQVVRYLRGNDFRPLAAYLPHAPVGPEADYRQYFGCPVHFEQRDAGLELRQSDLDAPVSSDALAHEAIVRYLDSIVTDINKGLVTPARDLVRRLLPTGAVTIDLIAAQFALHPKAFHRRLVAEGTTFRALLEQVRRELAEHFLRDTELGLTQVARELGYAEQSVLTRSCQRWYGRGPTALRHELRSQADAEA